MTDERKRLTIPRALLDYQARGGCDATAQEVKDDPKKQDCPAYYAEFMDRGEKLRLTIRSVDEELRVHRPDGMPKCSFDRNAMFELRDHIDFGVRKIRDAKELAKPSRNGKR